MPNRKFIFSMKARNGINCRFAKRKLDESVFLGNRLQVSYAPQFESLLDTKEKLEVRRKEVLGRMKCVLPCSSFPPNSMLFSLRCFNM